MINPAFVDYYPQEENLSKTLAMLQQVSKESIKSEDKMMEENAFYCNKVADLEKQV